MQGKRRGRSRGGSLETVGDVQDRGPHRSLAYLVLGVQPQEVVHDAAIECKVLPAGQVHCRLLADRTRGHSCTGFKFKA